MVENVSCKKHIIHANHNNADANKQKKQAWECIATSVSSHGILRSPEECRKKFQQWSSSVKSKAACVKRNFGATGGGSPPSPLTEIEENVV